MYMCLGVSASLLAVMRGELFEIAPNIYAPSDIPWYPVSLDYNIFSYLTGPGGPYKLDRVFLVLYDFVEVD